MMSKFDDNKFNEELKSKSKDIEIEVPERLRKKVLDTLDKLPENKTKKKSKYKNIAGIAGIIVAGLLTFNTIMPVYAEMLPVIGPTFRSINQVIGIGEKYIDGAKDIDLVDKYEDTTMTIKNIYYDGVELAIAYEIKCESGLKEKPQIFPLIRKGFKYLSFSNETHKGEFVDDKTYVGIASYIFDRDSLEDKTKITFVLNDIYGEWVGYFPEKFKFKLNLDAENMGKTIYKINKEFICDEGKFKITNIITSPLNTIIYWDAEITGLSFKAIDNNGMPINFESGGESISGIISNGYKGYWRFSEVPKDTKSITFIPYIQASSNEEHKKIIKLNKNGETLLKSTNGEYLIQKIEFEEDKTVIDVKVKEYLDRIDDMDIGFYDEEDNEIEYDRDNLKFNGIDDGYNYTIVLPKLDSEKEYYIKTYNDSKVLENEKITIDLEDKN